MEKDHNLTGSPMFPGGQTCCFSEPIHWTSLVVTTEYIGFLSDLICPAPGSLPLPRFRSWGGAMPEYFSWRLCIFETILPWWFLRWVLIMGFLQLIHSSSKPCLTSYNCCHGSWIVQHGSSLVQSLGLEGKLGGFLVLAVLLHAQTNGPCLEFEINAHSTSVTSTP